MARGELRGRVPGGASGGGVEAGSDLCRGPYDLYVPGAWTLPWQIVPGKFVRNTWL